MKRVREIVVSNVEIEDKFSWWFNTNDSQLYHFTLGKWSTLFGKASPTQDGLMSKEDKEVLISLSMGSSVVTVPTYADLESYAVKSEVILYVVKATNKIYRFSNNKPIEINTFYFNSLEDVKNLQGIGVYYVVVEQETYILYISQVGSQLTYILHSPKKYIECSYNTINSEWSDWVTTSYDAAGAILDIQNWVTAQVTQQNTTLSSMQEQITTIANSSTSNFNILYSSLNSLSLDVTNVKNNITTINDKISQTNNTINALVQYYNTLNNKIFNLENNYALKIWVDGKFATIHNLNIASGQINTNSLNIQGLTSRVVTLEEAMAALQDIPSSYLLKSEAENTYATIDALSSLEGQTLYNFDQITLHGIQIAFLQNNTITQADLDIINTRIAGLINNINSLYEVSATKEALITTNNNLADLETRVVVLEDNKAEKATTLEGYGITDAYTKVEVDAKVASVYTYKGTIADHATLLTLTNMQVGDVYNLLSTGENFSWTGSAWESLAGTIDLSAYLEKTEASTIYETKSNVAGLQLIVNNHTAAIGEIQESQLEIEGAVSALTIAQESFLTKVDASTLYTTKTLFNATADQVILNTSAISSLQTLKADKATTLSGYGITDAVTASDMASHIESNMHLSEAQRTKLSGIAAGAEVNVNADWNATEGDAQILNKPNTLTGYGITDVPNDNKTYGRLNGDWSEIVTSGGGGGGSIISKTWAALKFLRDTKTLVPGQSYRITDYTTTIVQANATSAGHDFDVIVTALSANKLSEDAKCVRKDGDTYFNRHMIYVPAQGSAPFVYTSDANELQGSDYFYAWYDSAQDLYLYTLVENPVPGVDLEYCREEDIIVLCEDGIASVSHIATKLEAWEIKYCIDNDTTKFPWADTENGKGVIYYMKDEYNNECPYDFKNTMFKLNKITQSTIDHSAYNNLIGSYQGTEINSSVLIQDLNDFIWCYTFDYCPQGEALHEDATIKYEHIHNNQINSSLGGFDSLATNVFKINQENQSIASNSIIGQDNVFNGECTLNRNVGEGVMIGNIFGENFSFNDIYNYFATNIVESDCTFNKFGMYSISNVITSGSSGNIFEGMNTFILLNKPINNCTFKLGVGYINITSSFDSIYRTSFNVRNDNSGSEDQMQITHQRPTEGGDYEWVIAKNSSGVIEQYCPEDRNEDILDLQTNKQDKLTAGENIVISGNVISAELTVDLNDYLTIDGATDTYETIENVQTLNNTVSEHTGDIESLEANKADTSHTHIKSEVGLSNVDNTSDTNKPVSTDQQTAINSGVAEAKTYADEKSALAIPLTQKGAASGVAELDASGKVLSSQLPSYVDDVLNYTTQSEFPATGESGKIYITEDTNKTYRWTGLAYVEISPSIALGTTSSTAYRGDRGLIAYDHSQAEHQTIINGTGFVKANGKTLSYDNSSYSLSSHTHTKSEVGLANVDNTSDLTKPISTATQTALDLKASQSDIDTAIDAIEIGGRNYVIDSERERVFVPMEIGKLNGFTGGETITLSFEAKYVGGDVLSIQILNGGIVLSGTQLLRINATSTNYTKHSQTITLPANLDNLRLVGWIGGTGSGTGYAKKFKVEKGNKATDWTPALEDPDANYLKLTGGTLTGSLSATNYLRSDGATIWHSGNDGAGSGLDADLLDGVHYDDISYGKYLGSSGPSYRTFIPFYRYDTTRDGSVVIGTFTTGRGDDKEGVGGNASNVIEVFSKNQIWQTGSNDDRNYILLKSTSYEGQKSQIYFATAMYNGQLWYGLHVYDFQGYGIYFKGYSSNTLTPIGFYKSYQGESILNSEIYNSITKVNPNNTITSPYYNYTKLALVTDNVASATKLQTGRTIAGVSFNGTANINIPFNNLSSKPNTLSGYGITDVPNDNKTYGRLNGDWSEIVTSGGGGGITDAPSDNKTYGRLNATWSEIDISSYINDSPSDGFIYGRKDGNWEQIDTSGGGDIKAYASERVNAVGGIIALKLGTKTIISNTLTNSDSLAITLPTPRLNFVNESILTIKIGATVPSIALPATIGWYTDVVTLAPNTTRTIVFEQITFDGITYEVWASCDKQ